MVTLTMGSWMVAGSIFRTERLLWFILGKAHFSKNGALRINATLPRAQRKRSELEVRLEAP